MKRILSALVLLAGSFASANAACPATFAVMKDNASSTFNMGLLSDANGNCTSKIDVDATGANNLYTVLNNALSALNTLNTTAQAPIPVIAGTLPSTQTPVTTGSTTKAQTDLNGNLYANPVSQYPAGSTPLAATATFPSGTTTATLTGTLTTTVYVCGYSFRANATAASNVTNSITGLLGGTRSDAMWVAPLASGIGIDEQVFMPCTPASAVNTAIAAAMPAIGSGGFGTVNIWGYYK
jgi:hypothetical protein